MPAVVLRAGIVRRPAERRRRIVELGVGAVGTAYGTTKFVNGKVTVTNIKRYPLEKVQPPEGVTSIDWIKGGMKPRK